MLFPSSNIVVSNTQEALWVLQQKAKPPTYVKNTANEMVVVSTSGDAKGPLRDLPVQQPPPVIPVPVTRSHLRALIIGIDTYASRRVPNLLGAVADADAMLKYIQSQLNVPESQIISLRNAEATRDAFVNSLKSMASDDRIQHGDPILLYYAGHGTTASAPTKWEAGSAEIQLIVSYDCFMKVNGRTVSAVPDRTLSVLLQRLADAKGDNITVIFDCCHSGSGTRKHLYDPTRRARGFDLEEQLPEGLDEDILALEIGDRAASVATKFVHAGLRSHVLLAACSATEVAMEERGRGLFTRALLEVLNVVGTEKITYRDLISHITDLPGQNPQCEGANMERVLFNSRAPSEHRVLYRVHQIEGKLTMEAGAVHGITLGCEFAIYAARGSEPMGVPLGTLTTSIIEAFSTRMTFLPGAAAFDVPSHACALQTRVGEEEAFRLHVEMDDRLASAFEALAVDMQYRVPGQRSILLVERHSADVEIVLEDGEIVFRILDSLTTGLGLTRMYQSVRPHVDDILPVIRGAAHYYWHLRRTPKKGSLRDKVRIEFTKLLETDEINDWLEPILVPDGPNLVDNGRVDLEADDSTIYGIRIVNMAKVPFYASMFYFDSSDLSIAAYYQASISGARADPSLNSEGTLSIGYGSGGAAPYKYFLRDGQNLDVGFIKLFLSTEPVDLSSVPQLSPFPGSRAPAPSHIRPSPLWDTVTIAVVQHAPGSLSQVQTLSPETSEWLPVPPSMEAPKSLLLIPALEDAAHVEHAASAPTGSSSPSPDVTPVLSSVTPANLVAATQPSTMQLEGQVPSESVPQDTPKDVASTPAAPQGSPSEEKSGYGRGRVGGYVRRAMVTIRRHVARFTCMS